MAILQKAITARSTCTQHNAFTPRRSPIPNHRPPEVLETNPNCPEASRRAVLLVLSLPVVTALLAIPRRAAAFSISITGPKEWLRDQKKKAARFVLAPIDASRQSLRNAYQAIGT